MLIHGFNELFKQNKTLSYQLQTQQNELNDKFDEQKSLLELKINELHQQLEDVLNEFNLVKQEKIQKENAKKARINRVRKPKRENMTVSIYHSLIQKNSSNNYKTCRLRIALCLLFIIGIRVSELLSLKVSQIKTLIHNDWIAVPGTKRGPSNHKAFLSKQGEKILNERKADFEYLCYSKADEDFIFTAEATPDEPLRR